jgi:hypothetical protein
MIGHHGDLRGDFTAEEIEEIQRDVAAFGREVTGNVRVHETGARRTTDADATRYDLITPIGLEEVAKAYAEGATKYGNFNWEKGFPASDLLNHALRHIYKFLEGDRSEPHLGHAAWGVLAAIHSDRLWPELNAPHLRTEGCKPPAQP